MLRVAITDAVGQVNTFARQDLLWDPAPGWALDTPGHPPSPAIGTASGLIPPSAIHVPACTPCTHGSSEGPEDESTSFVTSEPNAAVMVNEKGNPAAGDASTLSDPGECACRGGNASDSMTSTEVDTSLGLHTGMNGTWYQPPTGVSYSIGYGNNYADQGETGGPNACVGINPNDAFDALDKKYQDVYHKLYNEGWRFARSDDGSETTAGLDGEARDMNVDVTNDDWAGRLAEGQDVQWENDKWGVDFDNKVIYIDAWWDCHGTKILQWLAEQIINQGGEITKTDFHSKYNGWGQIGDQTDVTQWKSISDQRVASQIGFIHYSSAWESLGGAIDDQYGSGAFLAIVPAGNNGGMGAIGAALVGAKLAKTVARIVKHVSAARAARKALRAALIAAKRLKADQVAHHIVAWGAGKAGPAREILKTGWH